MNDLFLSKRKIILGISLLVAFFLNFLTFNRSEAVVEDKFHQPTAPHISKPKAIPHKVILKLKDSVAENLDDLLKNNKPIKNALVDQNDIFDQVKVKYKFKSAKNIFMDEQVQDEIKKKLKKASLNHGDLKQA